MTKTKKAEAGNFGSKTNFTGSEIQAFPSLNYSEDLDTIQSLILDRMNRKAKVIRCYRCLVCQRSYAASRMSSVLILCRSCYRTAGDKGSVAQGKLIDRIKNEISILLKGRLKTS